MMLVCSNCGSSVEIIDGDYISVLPCECGADGWVEEVSEAPESTIGGIKG